MILYKKKNNPWKRGLFLEKTLFPLSHKEEFIP